MERHAKERLVGAAVLIAAAVILIPEMLSGPKRSATASIPARAGEAPMKTYTIDLNHSPDAPASTPAVEERAPPQETVASEPETSAPASPAQVETSEPVPASAPTEAVAPHEESVEVPPAAAPKVIPESAPVKVPPAEPAGAEPPKPAERPAPVVKSAPKVLAPAATVPTSRQWAVQLGSFRSKSGAEGLAREWQERGQQALVMPIKSSSGTLYRVRLGPFAERSAAEAVLRKAGNKATGAAVVAHP